MGCRAHICEFLRHFGGHLRSRSYQGYCNMSSCDYRRKLLLIDQADGSINSKYFLMSLGHEGLNNLLAAYEDKTITSVCTFAYCAGPGQQPILFQGRTDGKLVPARGPSNFGKRIGIASLSYIRFVSAMASRARKMQGRHAYLWYIGWDPCFEYQGQTYAEMDKEEKVSSEWASESCSVADRCAEQDITSWESAGEAESMACGK